MKTILTILLLLSAFLFSSCATIFHGSTDNVNFSSEPAGANIYINGQLMGKSPMPLELKSNVTYMVEFRLKGFENKTIIINNKVDGLWVVLDVVFGLFPVVIDAATGNWCSLYPANAKVTFEFSDNFIFPDTSGTSSSKNSHRESSSNILVVKSSDTSDTLSIPSESINGKILTILKNKATNTNSTDVIALFNSTTIECSILSLEKGLGNYNVTIEDKKSHKKRVINTNLIREVYQK
jgi:hypothetical protein